MKNLSLLCIVTFLISGLVACGYDSDQLVSLILQEQNSTNTRDADEFYNIHQKQSSEQTQQPIKIWKGVAKGYLSMEEPTSSHVEFLIRKAQISAAVDSYRKFVTQSSKANSAVMSVFWKIEAASCLGPEIQLQYASIEPILKVNQLSRVDNALVKLAEPESISFLANNKEDAAKKRVKEYLQSINTNLEYSASETSSFKEMMLASSALLRKAGDMIQHAASVDGVIQDQVIFEKATSLIAATGKLKTAYCKDGNKIARSFSLAVGRLENKLLEKNDKVSASDVYDLAFAAHKMASGSSVDSDLASLTCLDQRFVSRD